MNSFILDRQSDMIISRTCGKFNEIHPNVSQMNNKKVFQIENSFGNFGANLKAPRQ